MKSFSSFHPLVLCYYFAGVTLLTMLTLHPLLLAFSFLGAMCFFTSVSMPKAAFSGFCFSLMLFLLISLTNPLFSPGGNTALFFLYGRPVTRESFMYGAALGGMIASMLLWFRCSHLTLESDKFLYLFGRRFPKLGLVLALALRFVPLYTRQIRTVYEAQKTLGLYDRTGIPGRAKGGLRVFSAVLTWALENAVDTVSSMKARGYGLPGRAGFSLFRFTARDVSMSAILSVLFGLLLTGGITGAFDFSYYPSVSPAPLPPSSLPYFAAALLLLFMPFLIQMKESLKWKFFRSRI